jgi:hypothetical protein
MANQAKQTGRGGVGMVPDPDSDTTGRGGESEGNPGVGELGIPLPTGDKPSPHGGTLDPDFEDITEPTGDANFPDPSKPMSMES